MPRALLPSVAGAAAALVTVALLAGGVVAAGPAHALDSAIVSEPFYADSGDKCEMGYTEGRLGWHVAGLRTVDVHGAVADRPWPDDLDTSCGDDGRYTLAIFTAYAEGVAVESTRLLGLRVGQLEGNNNHQEFSFALSSSRPIDSVVVQICRRPESPGAHEYCGKPQRYRVPVTTAG